MPFVPLDGFVGSIFPPSANSIQNYFLAAEESCLQPYGYSNISCYEQELQSIEIKPGETVAFDWTFQAIKNYSSLPGAKCIFTALNGTTKEIVTAAMVSTTAVREIAHLLVEAPKEGRNLFPCCCRRTHVQQMILFLKESLGRGQQQSLDCFI